MIEVRSFLVFAPVFALGLLGCAPKASQPPTSLPGLPERMDVTEIAAGLEIFEPRVLPCADRVGLTSGETIAIKFWIEGRTGSVQSAELVSPINPSLATCITAEIEAAGPALFPRFASERQGFTLKFHVP
jgi:hypothetical protein